MIGQAELLNWGEMTSVVAIVVAVAITAVALIRYTIPKIIDAATFQQAATHESFERTRQTFENTVAAICQDNASARIQHREEVERLRQNDEATNKSMWACMERLGERVEENTEQTRELIKELRKGD